MYNQLFSDQWVFDRCVESESIFIPLIVVISVFILIFLYRYLRMRKVRFIITLFLIPPIMFISSSLLGFSICSAGSIWKGIRPALELDNKMKKVCADNKCPISEDELSRLDTDLYQQISSNAKIKYNYNQSTGEYVWYVRPSRYYVGIFQKGTFSLYKIPSFLPIRHWNNVPDYNDKVGLLP